MDAAEDAVRQLLPAARPYLLRPARRARRRQRGPPVPRREHHAERRLHTVWTITLREGITFHDGTAAQRRRRDQEPAAGRGRLPRQQARCSDVAKNPDGTFKIEKVDDLTFDIYIGQERRSGPAVVVANFDILPRPASGGSWPVPTWLDASLTDPSLEAKPVGSGPFVFDSYTPNDKLVVKKNPNYWQTDADGNPLPYLDEIEFRVINDSVDRAERAGERRRRRHLDVERPGDRRVPRAGGRVPDGRAGASTARPTTSCCTSPRKAPPSPTSGSAAPSRRRSTARS